MKWTEEAENAVKKVPFFVRKKVRSRVEEQARAAGRKVVALADVKTAQARFLEKMSRDIKGYQLDTCFGPGGCPNRAMPSDALLARIEAVLAEADLLAFLKSQVKGDLKYHHEFRVTVAECPNACSQPQIKDIGVIGAVQPAVADPACTGCEACVEACPDDCIELTPERNAPRIDMQKCIACGKCIAACPTGALAVKSKGYRVQLGGKLGRHPRLATELPGIYTDEEVLEIVKYCITFVKRNSTGGERFAEIFRSSDLDALLVHLRRKVSGRN